MSVMACGYSTQDDGSNIRLEPSCCRPALTAAAACNEVEADRLGEGEGEPGCRWVGEEAGSMFVVLTEGMLAKAGGGGGGARAGEGDDKAGWEAVGNSGDVGGRAEGGSELRSGMAVPTAGSLVFVLLSLLFSRRGIWLAQ